MIVSITLLTIAACPRSLAALCLPSPEPKVAFAQADVVFIGHMTPSPEPQYEGAAVFVLEVVTVYKGELEPGQRVAIHTDLDGCGVHMDDSDETWIIHAEYWSGGLSSDSCGRSKRSKWGREDRRFLRTLDPVAPPPSSARCSVTDEPSDIAPVLLVLLWPLLRRCRATR